MDVAAGDAVIVHRHRRHVMSGADERGITLIEMVIAIVLIGLLVGGVTQVLVSTYRGSSDTISHLDSSSSAFLTGARFSEDIDATASIPATSTPAISRNVSGCVGDATVLLRLVSPSTDASSVRVTTYSVGPGPSLLRRTCSGATFATAVAAPVRTIRVVRKLKPGATPVTVTCRATARAKAAPTTPAGDVQCRIVTLRATTSTGYAFEVKGVRSTQDSEDVSPPVERRCTLLASDNAQVYEDQPNRNFNDHDDYGGDGRTYIEDRNRSGYTIRAYLRFDLSSACQDTAAGEPPFMPPGKALTSASLKLTYVESARDSGGNRCDSTHTLQVVNEPWDATTLTWNTPVNQHFTIDPSNPPAGQTPGLKPLRQGFRTYATWTSETQSFPVLEDVRHWYPGLAAPGVGDWLNYGWAISSQGTCDHQESHKWMSKGSNSDLSPHLVITWSE